MNISTTQRRFWLLAAMITSLAGGQALAESKVDVRLKKRAARPVAAAAIRQSASRDASGLARQLTPAKVLRDGKLRDDRPKPTTRQKASVDHARDQVGGLREIGPLGQDSASTIISQTDIDRLRMIEKILDIRELFELHSLIGRDLAHTHDHLMDMMDAAFQNLMDIIAAKMGRMSGVGLAEERAAYDDDTVFGWFSDLLEDWCSDDGEGRFDDPDGDGFPTQLMTTTTATESKTKTTQIPMTRTYRFFLKTKSGCCPPAFQESWPMNSCTSGLSTTWTMDHFWKVIFMSCCIWRSRTG